MWRRPMIFVNLGGLALLLVGLTVPYRTMLGWVDPVTGQTQEANPRGTGTFPLPRATVIARCMGVMAAVRCLSSDSGEGGVDFRILNHRDTETQRSDREEKRGGVENGSSRPISCAFPRESSLPVSVSLCLCGS